MSEEVETRKIRKCTTKSRRGCRTCKFRRLKCDEQRPSCQRCLHWGVGICGGYAEAARRSIRGPTHQLLQPAILQEPASGLQFRNEEEFRYFQLFRDQVTPSLGGAFDNSLWDHVVAQACISESFVLDSVIAIGALTRAMNTHLQIPIRQYSFLQYEPTGDKSYITSYEYALKRYDKAIKSMKRALANRELDVRKALIACLLVFCFETHIGNQASAIHHAQSGITMLHKWQYTRKSLGMTAGKPLCMIEDELIQAVGRLDLQVLILLDLRPLEIHQAIKKDLSTALQHMPSVFVTLTEAKVWCELIMRQTLHFRAVSMAVGKSHEIDIKGPPLQWEDAIDTPMGTNVLHDPREVPVTLIPEYQAHVLQWNRWSLAFRLLFNSLRASQHNDWVGATVLLIQAKMNFICLASAFSTVEIFYDTFLAEFQQIITLAESIYEKLITKGGSHFLYRFDGGLIPSLFVVATKCRDRSLRRQAINLLSLSPWREGVFDSICCQKMATWIMCVEEEGIGDQEVIPEHRRLKIRRSNIDLPRRRVQLQGTQFKTANDVKPEWRETILTW